MTRKFPRIWVGFSSCLHRPWSRFSADMKKRDDIAGNWKIETKEIELIQDPLECVQSKERLDSLNNFKVDLIESSTSLFWDASRNTGIRHL